MGRGSDVTTYRVAPGVLKAELGGRQVLLNPDTAQYHLVNATGKRLLALFDEGFSFEESVSRLAEEVDEPVDLINSDATRFVSAMLERELIKEEG
jgi:hypothetical protein